jgi:L-gulonolactone oxidase
VKGRQAGPGEWRNWCGDQGCRPARIVHPQTREELVEVVRHAAAAGETVKVPGSGHSFTEAALTDGVMARIEALDGILEVDKEMGRVTVEAGIVLRDLNTRLHELGLAMPNLGDIDRQTLAGAISTATHGTGAGLQNISAQVVGLELVTGTGEVLELSEESDSDAFRAARVGVGALGAICAVTLQTVPSFLLHRIDRPEPIDEVLANFDSLSHAHDHFEFFVFPYTDTAVTIRRDRTSEPPRRRSSAEVFITEKVLQNRLGGAIARLTRARPSLIPRVTRTMARVFSEGDYIDDSFAIFSSEREIPFNEMEYALPREHGPAVVRRVLDWIEEQRYPVGFPIECRVVAPDDALLSPSHERATTYVAVHQFIGMDYGPYFEAVESIMAEYGGRPHWGKRHTLDHARLEQLYPRFGDFLAVRDRLDPQRVFANDYTRRCFGD